jgi:hypothetical protein
MYPGFFHWWKEAQRHGGGACHAGVGCGAGAGPSRRHGARPEGADAHEAWASGEDGGGSFGVRRPLRFMAWKLELNEPQVEQLAAILADLKTERAQASVDHRRSVGLFADALEENARNPMVGLSPQTLFDYYAREKASDAWTGATEFH